MVWVSGGSILMKNKSINIQNTYKIILISFMIITLALSLGCASKPSEQDTLYHDLGEMQGITELVDLFINNLADDNRINHFFADSNILRFREKLIEQFCEISNGPCIYTGDNMKLTHAGANYNDANFNALVEDLYDALEELNYTVATQNQLLARLAPMYTEIVRDGVGYDPQ